MHLNLVKFSSSKLLSLSEKQLKPNVLQNEFLQLNIRALNFLARSFSTRIRVGTTGDTMILLLGHSRLISTTLANQSSNVFSISTEPFRLAFLSVIDAHLDNDVTVSNCIMRIDLIYCVCLNTLSYNFLTQITTS